MFRLVVLILFVRMIIYNVTYNVTPEIEQQWIEWMNDHHIPSVLATGFFGSSKIFRLLTEVVENGLTYCCQYYAEDKKELSSYLENHEEQFELVIRSKFGDRCLFFSSILEEL